MAIPRLLLRLTGSLTSYGGESFSNVTRFGQYSGCAIQVATARSLNTAGWAKIKAVSYDLRALYSEYRVWIFPDE